MKKTWIIENLTKEPSYIELAEAVVANGHNIVRLNGDYNPELLNNYVDDENVIVAASIQMNKLIREKLPKAKIYSTWKNYLCTSYYPRLGKFLFNDKYIMMPLVELARQKWDVYGWLAKDTCIFVRPDDGDKTFTGQILDIQDFDKFYEQNCHCDYDLVLASSPKNILGEWRFVVTKKGEIVAQSCYRYRGSKTLVPSAPKEATELVEKILEIAYYPDEVFCIDIAEGADNQYYLLELTSFSSAGLYACNKDAIVKKISELANG